MRNVHAFAVHAVCQVVPLCLGVCVRASVRRCRLIFCVQLCKCLCIHICTSTCTCKVLSRVICVCVCVCVCWVWMKGEEGWEQRKK